MPRVGGPVEPSPGTTTAPFAQIDLSGDPMLLLLALAEPRLRWPGDDRPLPTTAEACARLGWTSSKFNRALDRLCSRLTRMGVRGLSGSEQSAALDRRRHLFDHALANRMVTADDLHLLDEQPRSAG